MSVYTIRYLPLPTPWSPWFRLHLQAAVSKPIQRGPAGPALDVKSGLSLEVVTGKAARAGECTARPVGLGDGTGGVNLFGGQAGCAAIVA